MINFFNFRKLGKEYLLTNDLGRFMFVSKNELCSLILDKVDKNQNFLQEAKNKFFYFDESVQAFSEKLIPYLRESKNYLFSSTCLHIFVVTNACNQQCKYCQAQNGEKIPCEKMPRGIAKRAVDIALSSPGRYLTFEFQGGEPLLNFDVIKFIIEYTQSKKGNKEISFNIVSNLTLLNDEIISFIKQHNIGISTSLDGPKEIHDFNRPIKNTISSPHDLTCTGIKQLRQRGIEVGAIQTTTKKCLFHAKDIINEYEKMQFSQIFIRPLTPLGKANRYWSEIGYTAGEFVEFYKECFSHILDLNRQGILIKEGHASIMLSKILSNSPQNYMELRSPCGASVGQVAYYCDGNIYTCDEGRMLAEMGDNAFKLGDVNTSTYEELIRCPNCRAASVASITESMPGCCDCAYQPYCGVCPVVNYACGKDIYTKEANGYKCTIYKGIFDTIFTALKNSEEEKILYSWL